MQTTDGDAMYFKTPHGKEIIVDGGIDGSVLSALARHRLFWDKTIDLLIITHPDADHYYGGLEVLKRFSVRNIMLTGVLKDDPKYAELFAIAKQKGSNVIIADSTQDMKIDGITFDVLFPFESIYGSKEFSNNNAALLIKMHYKNHSLLLTGDIESESEKLLLEKGVDLSAEILKVAHHGSKSSSTQSFLEAVRPSLAIITAGSKNRFEHPHQETLDRLKQNHIPFRSTKTEGDIKIEWK